MSQQRSVGAAGSGQSPSGSGGGGGGAQQRSYPEVHHLMPSGLQRIPGWYEGGGFRHSRRVLVGVVPGAILLITVTGIPMLTAILGGVFFTLLVRYLNHGWASMMLTVCHVIFLEFVNVYCMAPLIWRSVLNLPLYAIFHLFIAITGVLWWLQEKEFQKQEPRFSIMLERMLFFLYPAISVTMVAWMSGILLGMLSLPFVLLLAGVLAFSVYLVPLQSSFVKPNTPPDVGLIQHRFVVWVYAVLLMVIPALSYAALSYQETLQSFLLLGLLLTSPPFLLSLLEAQGVGKWFGMGSSVMQAFRMVTGVIVLVLVTACVSLAQPSSFLPLLLLPLLLLTMALISFVDHAPSSTSTLVVGGALAVLYTFAFAELPWYITHASSFLYLPLSVLQLLLWVMALVGVALMTFWGKVSPKALGVYNGAFVVFEFILTSDDIYPVSVSMTTSIVAIFTFWRLYVVGGVSPTTSLVSMCMHITKLSLLFPCAHSSSPITSSLLPFSSTFLTSLLLLRLFLFDHAPSLGSGQLLAYSGLLFGGLLLSVDTILSPIWASLTHTLPSSATLLATVLGMVALYVNYGLGLLESQDRPPLISSFPPGLGVMASLLWTLQPEFDVSELVGSAMVTLSGGSDYPPSLYLAAWQNLLTWLVLFSTIFALLQLAFNGHPLLTISSTSLLGTMAGFLAAISLLQLPPEAVGSLLYAAILGVGGALCGRAHSTHKKSSLLPDRIMFIVLFALFLISYCMEWLTHPHYYIPGVSPLEHYAKPCTMVMMCCCLVLAVVCRVKMYCWQGEPYLPLMANLTCFIFFITASIQHFHQQLETMVLLSSLVFLLSQPDGLLRPKRSFIFVAPCLVCAILFLYAVSLSYLLPFLTRAMQHSITLYTAGRLAELLFLVLSIPGHALFLYWLWVDRGPALPIRYAMAFVLPHAFLPQAASNLATTILGSLGIFSFCLIIIGDYTLGANKLTREN